jgi:hypothetical protein
MKPRYSHTGRPWDTEFFHLAGSWLACRNAALDYPEPLPDGSVYCPYGLIVGELAVQSEMHLVLKEAGMLPAQRLGRCAGRLLCGAANGGTIRG